MQSMDFITVIAQFWYYQGINLPISQPSGRSPQGRPAAPSPGHHPQPITHPKPCKSSAGPIDLCCGGADTGAGYPFAATTIFSLYITLLELFSRILMLGSRCGCPEQGLRDGCTDVCLAAFTKSMLPLGASQNLSAPGLTVPETADTCHQPASPSWFSHRLLSSPSFTLNPQPGQIILCPPKTSSAEEAASSHRALCSAQIPLWPSQAEKPPSACTAQLRCSVVLAAKQDNRRDPPRGILHCSP